MNDILKHCIIIFLIMVTLYLSYLQLQNIKFRVKLSFDNDTTEVEGFDEYMKAAKKTSPKYRCGCSNLKANMFETRLPDLVDQKYIYNDKIKNITLGDSIGANLGELPLELKNRYSALVPKFMVLDDPLFYNVNF